MANYGAKTVTPTGAMVPVMGVEIPQVGVVTYADGGAAPYADLLTADQGKGGPTGLRDDQLRFLRARMIAGRTYAQATTDLNATLQANQQPPAAVYAAFQALITAQAAMNPPYDPQ